MNIVKFQIYRFSLKLKKPLQFKNTVINNREGLLVKLTDDADNSGYGEISPLPLFSLETFDEALEQVKSLSRKVPSDDLLKEIKSDEPDLFPSVVFGLESALINVMAHSKSLGMSSLINVNSSNEVTVNALLSGTPKQVLKDIRRKIKRGYKSFKLKIGNQKVEDDLELVKSVRDIIGDLAVLRLDANRSYNRDDALGVIEAVKNYNIEYIEEPFAGHDDLLDYIAKNEESIIALDESLRDMSITDIENYKNINAMILKPTMMGFTKTMEYARYAISHNIIPVISSSYESVFGIITLASMAAVINSDQFNIPVGLDTLDRFASNLCPDDDIISNGRIDLRQHSFIYNKIRNKKLTEVFSG